MNYIINQKINQQTWLFIFGILLSLLISIGIIWDLKIIVALIGAIVCVILIIKCSSNPFPVIIFLLILRPSMESIGGYRILGVGAQMLSSIILLIGGMLYLYNSSKLSSLLNDSISRAFIIYIFFNILSFILNKKLSISSSLSGIFTFVTYLILYTVGRYTGNSKKNIQWIFCAILLSIIIPNLIAILQLINNTGMGFELRGVKAIYGTFFHPNMYANYLIMACTSNLYFILENKYKKLNIFFLLINIFLLINCYGRAALLSLIMIFTVVSFVKKRSLILIGIFIIILFPVIFNETFNALYYRFVVVPSETGDYLSGRQYLWATLLNIFKSHWIIGVGPSLFYPFYHMWDAHNEILRNLVEIGVFGTITYVILWNIIIVQSTINLIRYFSNETFVFILILLSIIWLSMTSNLITCAEVLWAFWFLLGATLHYNERKSISQEE